MKALTLTQPWAGLVASGIKLIENRNRRPPSKLLGERIAIHASRECRREIWPRIIEIDPSTALDYPGPMGPRARLHQLAEITSAVIGIATLVTYVTRADQIAKYTDPDQRRWYFGLVGYVFDDTRILASPVPCRGALGFWTLPTDVESRVQEQLR